MAELPSTVTALRSTAAPVNRRRARLILLFRWLLALGAAVVFVLYARRIQWRMVWESIRGATFSLLLVALVANLVTLLARGILWWLFLKPMGARSIGLAVRATIAGAGVNNVLVANSGEVVRVVAVANASGVRRSSVVAALALERMFDIMGYVLLLALAAFLLPVPDQIARIRGWAAVAVGISAVAVALLIYRSDRHRRQAPTTGEPPRGRVRAWFARFADTVHDVVTPSRMAEAGGLTVVNWGTQVLCYHLVGVAAHYPITLAGSIVCLLTVNVGFLIRATPGNVGVFQVVYAVTAEALGFDHDGAVAVAVLIQTLQNVPVVLLAAAVAPDLVFKRGSLAAPTPEET